ncbi:MAG: DoxX family protein [Pseudomonadota bacterium]|nr:DoxX family protein [Pseudomonadota bacterium]
MSGRPNPIQDVVGFLTGLEWTTFAFWLLLIASTVIAVSAWRRDPSQRSARNIGVWLLRLIIGIMWWQQSLWKIPPNYDGLIHWMKEMVDHASTSLQSALVDQFVLPHIAIFGPLVYLVEVAIGISLMLGVLTRLGALLGALMAVNLWLGLYSPPGEWPWTYFFLIVIQTLFVIDPPGLSLGADVLINLRRRSPQVAQAA